MGKTKTIFLSSDRSKIQNELHCLANMFDEIYISVQNPNDDTDYLCVSLDLQTAIKFSKHLKREIAIIKESEVKNG